MPAPVLRVVRKPRTRRTLIAASQPITDPQNVFRTNLGWVVNPHDWQTEAWDMLDLVGELRYYVGWRSASCSRVRLVASDINPETGLPTGGTENQRVNDIVTSIAGGTLGQAQLIKRAVQCLTVPGEVWIAIIITASGERWLALTREEIHRNGRAVEIDLPEGGRHELNMPGTDSLMRVWNPRPRLAQEADSPVRACLDSLREIVRTTRTIAQAGKSRLSGNGVLFVPQEMSMPAFNPVAVNQNSGQLEGVMQGTPAVQKLIEQLWQVANTAVDDEDSMANFLPVIASVPGEQVKNVAHIRFDNTITDLAIKIRSDAVSRLAMGLDVAPERLLGLGDSTNHWSSYQIADEDVQLHINPVMETICQALSDQVFRAVLERDGIDPEKYVMWYDASQLTIDPDKTDNATAAFDRGAINAEAYREFLGLGDDTGHDFNTIEGWQVWAQQMVSAHPELLSTYAPLLGPISEAFPEISATYTPPAAIEAPPEQQQQPTAEPGTENNPPPQAEQPAARVHNDVYMALVDLHVNRALELAGKRRRTHSDHGRLRDVPMHETHRYMPPVRETDIPKLINGWDASLEDEVLARLHIDGDELRVAVRRVVRAELTAQMVDA